MILMQRLLDIECEGIEDRLSQDPGDLMSSEYIFRTSMCSEQSILIMCHSENDCIGSKKAISGPEVILSHSQVYYRWSDEVGTIAGWQ